MPKYSVDVKAFITIEVEAASVASARAEADRFAEGLSPNEHYVTGWNSVQKLKGGPILGTVGELSVDGTSEVERICEECGEFTDDVSQALHPECHDELEPPLDTPSLDTSFHDHEMDV